MLNVLIVTSIIHIVSLWSSDLAPYFNSFTVPMVFTNMPVPTEQQGQ